MYRCQVTNRVSRPGEKLNKIVVETRDKTYYEDDVEIGYGHETVREISVSDEGARIWSGMSDEERKTFLSEIRR